MKLGFVIWMPTDVMLVGEYFMMVWLHTALFNAVFLHQQQRENFTVKRNQNKFQAFTCFRYSNFHVKF